MRDKFEETQVVIDLNKKLDLRVEGGQIKEMLPPHSKGDVGIKSRGKIDFLTKYRGYTHFYVSKF